MQETLQDKLKELKDLYATIPATKCLKTSCADWCCSRLPEAVSDSGHFISLPLVYSIEFLDIREYIYSHFSKKDINEFYDYSSKKPLCCFKDPETPGCLVYPVRPFTCRVFGRRVPPIFWGMDYPPEAVDRIFCPNLSISDKQEEIRFLDRYPLFWEKLSSLSASVSVFSKEQLQAIHEVSDVEDLYITGWKEFALLSSSTPDWLKKNFAEFWKIHGNLL